MTRLEAARGQLRPGRARARRRSTTSALTEEVARAVAGALREVGITHDLAPVADVNTNPLNPVDRRALVRVRSGARRPPRRGVRRRACRTGGVAACAKHFPGHGATEVDSHLGLPGRRGEPARSCGAVELVPFAPRSRPARGRVMTAHIVVPAIDALPATLSRPMLTGLLRERARLHRDGRHRRARDGGDQRDGTGWRRRAVLALAAGRRRALPRPRHRRGRTSRSCAAAIVAAVRQGGSPRSGSPRRRGASPRRTRPPPRPRRSGRSAEVGLAAARRALRVHGRVGGAGPRARRRARGHRSRSRRARSHTTSPAILRELGADAETLHLGTCDLAAAVAAVQAHPERRPVVVVRDVDRHPWQRSRRRRASPRRAGRRGRRRRLPGRAAALRARRRDDVRRRPCEPHGRGASCSDRTALAAPARRPRRRGRGRTGRARRRAGRSRSTARPARRRARRRPTSPSPSRRSGASATSSRCSRERSQPATSSASARGPSTRSFSIDADLRPELREAAPPGQRPREGDVRDGDAVEELGETRVRGRGRRHSDESTTSRSAIAVISANSFDSHAGLAAPAAEDRQVGDEERQQDRRRMAGRRAAEPELDHLREDLAREPLAAAKSFSSTARLDPARAARRRG